MGSDETAVRQLEALSLLGTQWLCPVVEARERSPPREIRVHSRNYVDNVVYSPVPVALPVINRAGGSIYQGIWGTP